MRLFALLLCWISLCHFAAAEDAPATSGTDQAAILAAARAADEEYQRSLALLMKDIDSDRESVRIFAIRQLGLMQEPTAAPKIMPFLDAHVHPKAVVLVAVESVCDLASEAAAVPMQQLLESADPEIRLAAVNGLTRLKAITAGNYMRRSGDERDATRASSLTELGTMKHEEALEVLTKGMVNDHSPHIRRMCAIGLGDLADKSSANVLIDSLCDSDPGVRRYAAEALVKLGHKQAIPSLLMAMEANVAGDYLNHAVMILSGQDFGFDSKANSLARSNAIESGFAWWAQNASTLE